MKGDSDKAFHENVLFNTTCFVPLKEDFVKILLGCFLSGLYFEKYFCVQLSDLSIHLQRPLYRWKHRGPETGVDFPQEEEQPERGWGYFSCIGLWH